MSSSQKFKVNDKVLVLDLEREQGLSGHMRAPVYCRNQIGTVERCCGVFGNPELLAYGKNGEPKQPLYRVRFNQNTLWPNYTGSASDTIEIEIYQHWLEPYAP